MRPRDFEIGKVYHIRTVYRENNTHDTFVRISEVDCVRVSETIASGNIYPIEGLQKDYGEFYEISPDDLLGRGKSVYLKYFPKQQSCTCDIQDIMTKGCTCGWLEKERS